MRQPSWQRASAYSKARIKTAMDFFYRALMIEMLILCAKFCGDTLAKVWDDVWRNRRTVSDYSLQYRRFMSSFSKKLPLGAKVLEAGCGSGDTLACFKGQKTYGLDFSEQSLRLAKKNADYVVKADLFRMPFSDNYFDLVYNSGVLEHYKYPKNVEGAREMARVTKKGGYVIIILPNIYCLWFVLYKRLVVALTGKWEFGYEEEYSPQRLKALAERAGLKVVHRFGLQALPPFATNRFQMLPLWLRKYLIRLDALFPLREYYAFGTGIICRKI